MQSQIKLKELNQDKDRISKPPIRARGPINTSNNISPYKFQLMNSETPETLFPNAKWELKPKLHRYPTKRWGHTATLLKNKIYIYGGKTGKSKESLYELDCDTLESHILDAGTLSESRESHSCSAVKDKLYFFGGCSQNKALNDLLSLSIKDRTCSSITVNKGTPIKERESHATTVIKDQYILVYGGCDDELIYDDFWILDTTTDQWFQVKNIVHKMKKRLSCTLTTVGSKIYMFGGECQDETYENSLYVLEFSTLDFSFPKKIPSLTCSLIHPKGFTPPPRSGHAAALLKNQYILILGGEGGFQANEKKPPILLDDFWAFDTVNKSWTQIEGASKSIFKPRSCMTINIYENKLFVFGGLISMENFRSTDELFVFSFSDSTDKKIELCNFCKQHFIPACIQSSKKDILNITLESSLKIALSDTFKIAQCIRNPLDAFCIILEGFHRMKYQMLKINVNGSKNIIIQGEGLCLNEKDFMPFLFNYDFMDDLSFEEQHVQHAVSHRIQAQNLQILNQNIKNASSRLGNCYLIVNRRLSLVDLLLIKPDGVIYCEVSCEQDTKIDQKQKDSYRIIQEFMEAHEIKYCAFKDQSLSIIVTELRNKDNFSKNFCEEDIINHISSYFLHEPKMQVELNGKLINFENLYKQFESLPQIQLLDSDGKPAYNLYLIKLQQKDMNKQAKITVYRCGYRVWQYHDTQFTGYLSIPSSHFSLNLMRTKLGPLSQKYLEGCVKQIIEKVGNQVDKRPRFHESEMDESRIQRTTKNQKIIL